MNKSFLSLSLPWVSMLLLIATPDSAEARCAGAVVGEIRSLIGLPRDLRRLLPEEKGLDGIADRGERFNVTDVVDRDLPMRRFVLAAVGDDCAVVAVERGGRAHHFELTEYHLAKGAWFSLGSENVNRQPNSTDELLNWHDPQ